MPWQLRPKRENVLAYSFRFFSLRSFLSFDRPLLVRFFLYGFNSSIRHEENLSPQPGYKATPVQEALGVGTAVGAVW